MTEPKKRLAHELLILLLLGQGDEVKELNTTVFGDQSWHTALTALWLLVKMGPLKNPKHNAAIASALVSIVMRTDEDCPLDFAGGTEDVEFELWVKAFNMYSVGPTLKASFDAWEGDESVKDRLRAVLVLDGLVTESDLSDTEPTAPAENVRHEEPTAAAQ